jgi:hypothetical protein
LFELAESADFISATCPTGKNFAFQRGSPPVLTGPRTIAFAFGSALGLEFFLSDISVPEQLAMDKAIIPEDLRRFILTSVPSVPFLEALLLLRADPAQAWHAETLARRLYISERVAEALLDDLCKAGIAACPGAGGYRYHPAAETLRDRIDELAELYAKHLVDVTNLIHSSLDRKAQQFADAFKWRKDT